MSRRWSGTDGIRGIANVALTPELAMRAGRATARILKEEAGAGILIGRDTRASGPLLQAAISAGIAAEGGTAYLAGIIPTPGVSRLVASGEYDGGIVISACHHPYRYNALTVFESGGNKLNAAHEAQVEAVMEDLKGANGLEPQETGGGDDPAIGVGGQPAVGAIVHVEESSARYVDDLLRRLELNLRGLRILLDCAHGATYRVAPVAFRAAGAHVEVLCDRPDGRNINEGCGSADLGLLRGRMEQGTFDLGLAFDGDGDRVLAVDGRGREVNGDRIMGILAASLASRGKLEGKTFVEQTGAVLGGEQSGHIIYLAAGPAGDGMQTGLLLADALKRSDSSLADLAEG